MKKHAAVLLGLAAGLGLQMAGAGEAQACGGCFAPQDNPTVVTDHRMIMTIAADQSTLYDQIKYTGDPKSFAWVLPYAGDIEVGLSSDTVFSAIDQLTQTTILPPPGCVNNGGGSSGASGTSASPASSSGGGAGGVTVIKQQVVGPYDTVQLAATDPQALENWLKTNGFDIPADVAPVINNYVGEHFNFLALKLIPDKGIQDMRPVRVTTKGTNTTLPLRMVAAGTGATVGISLWVLGGGRYEPQNFGSFIIDDNDLGWDVSTQKSNYTEVRALLNAKGAGAVWEVESSTFLAPQQVTQYVQYSSGPYNGGTSSGSGQSDPSDDYPPVKDAQGNITKTSIAARTEDLTILLANNNPALRVTRMRADLAHTALTTDLTLRASTDQSLLSNTRQLTRCGLPSDPNSTVIRPGDSQTPDPKATPAPTPAAATDSGSTFTCNTGVSGTNTWATVGFAFCAIALARKVRRRQRSS